MEKLKLEQYIQENKSSYEIAKLENKGQSTVSYWLKKHGLKTNKINKPLTKEEKREKARQKAKKHYYSAKNQINCYICDKSIRKRQSNKTKQACKDCDLKRRKRAPKNLTYKMIKAPDDHIGRVNKNGWIEEHRYLAQKHLGRELKTSEVVHHIDNNRKNNNLNNLCVLDGSIHSSYHNHCFDNDIQINKQSLLDFVENCVIFFDLKL